VHFEDGSLAWRIDFPKKLHPFKILKMICHHYQLSVGTIWDHPSQQLPSSFQTGRVERWTLYPWNFLIAAGLHFHNLVTLCLFFLTCKPDAVRPAPSQHQELAQDLQKGIDFEASLTPWPECEQGTQRTEF